MDVIDASEIREELREIGERIGESASVDRVFGDPIETHGRTIVPVARIAYGFGAGAGGEGLGDRDEGTEIPIDEGNDDEDEAEVDEGEAEVDEGEVEVDENEAEVDEGEAGTGEGDDRAIPDRFADLDLDPEAREALEDAMASMGGRGGGGGAVAVPLGVVEVTEEGTRFLRFGARRRLAAVALGGLAVGLALGVGVARGRGRARAAEDENAGRIRVPVE